jgi:hypothetical protein
VTGGDDQPVRALAELLHERVVRVDDERPVQSGEAVALHLPRSLSSDNLRCRGNRETEDQSVLPEHDLGEERGGVEVGDGGGGY